MQEQLNRRFNRKMIVLGPGEYYASGEDLVISTILGSCVAACLYDPVSNIIGMNHFLLVGDNAKSEHYFLSESGRYGINAMELLINEMMKMGAKRHRIKAKTFGGAHVLKTVDRGFTSIPENNITFIKTFLETEKIDLVSNDLGGQTGRKIFFFNFSFKVLLKKLDSTTATYAESTELKYWNLEKSKLLEKVKSDKIDDKNEVDFF